jgi:hypothetical protein
MLHAMKAYGGLKVKLHSFLTSTLNEGEWSASRPHTFTPGERNPVYGRQGLNVCQCKTGHLANKRLESYLEVNLSDQF